MVLSLRNEGIEGQSRPEAGLGGSVDPCVSDLVRHARGFAWDYVTELFHRTALHRSYQSWTLLELLLLLDFLLEEREMGDCHSSKRKVVLCFVFMLPVSVPRKACHSTLVFSSPLSQSRNKRAQERRKGGWKRMFQIIWHTDLKIFANNLIFSFYPFYR